MRFASNAVIAACLVAVPLNAAEGPGGSSITWKKTVLDKVFRSEGVAIGDVNKDGQPDVLTGETWYESPNWKMHEICKPGNYGDGLNSYSESFCCWTEDFNKDGWVDLLVIGFPGKPCHWYENPKGQPGHWKKHVIWHSACNETPQYVDLFGTGKRVLLMGWQPQGKENEGQMAYFTPGEDPTKPWQMHPISGPSEPGKPVPGTHRFSHGLGVGDLNGDGKQDVICNGGWWEQPARVEDKPWRFHPAKIGEACADMYAIDFDGDGKNDVFSTSAHKFGIWVHKQKPGKNADEPVFVTETLYKDLLSETHAVHYLDVNGDGLKDIVTGKRWWSHGRREPGHDMPARLYWFKAERKDGILSFKPNVIDEDSGIGTQFAVMDGPYHKPGAFTPPWFAVANKKGVFLFVPEPAKQATPEKKPEEQGTRRKLVQPAKPGASTSLFNGKDLEGWDTWLGKPGGAKEVVGLNKDPNKVYSVVMLDGQPAIRISGEIFGALTTKADYENYHLSLEFKWGEKKWPPREKAKRDSGLLYHCVGPHGKQGSFWMESLECQIQEGDCGDFYSVAGPIIDVEGTRMGDKGPITFKQGGTLFKGTTSRIIRDVDHEKPGSWNRIEVYCLGGTAVHLVNGKVNLVLTNSRHKVEGKEVPLTKGKIQLQSEGAEIFYRNLHLQPITQIPEEILKGTGR